MIIFKQVSDQGSINNKTFSFTNSRIYLTLYLQIPLSSFCAAHISMHLKFKEAGLYFGS